MNESPHPPRISYCGDQRSGGALAFDALKILMAADSSSRGTAFDWAEAAPAPCDTDAMAMLALSEKKSDFALLPFIQDNGAYDELALHDLNSLFDIVATGIINITEDYCLVARKDDVAAVRYQRAGATPPIRAVFTTQRGEKACRSALEGLAANGASVSLVTSSHAAGAATVAIDRSRSPNNAIGDLHAAIMPKHLVAQNSRYEILRDNLTERRCRRFLLVLQRAADKSVYFDKYRTTDARTRYFYRRMKRLRAESHHPQGLGVILRFKRSAAAAATSDVEAFLRRYGVRYAVFDLPNRDNTGAPAPRILDIEFDARDFSYNPARRLRGSVANGALKRAFARWKDRGVQVVGAMPLDQFRMRRPRQRRWWWEGAASVAGDAVDTLFIRLSRLLFGALAITLFAALVVGGVWFFAV